MKNTFGNNVSITLFGESHGQAIGAVLDGMPSGILVDIDFIKSQLSLRRPSGDISTKRVEDDNFEIISGVFNGYTTGAPICIIIPNNNKISNDYSNNRSLARPSHADFTAFKKYSGFEDYRGGGHFSGRLTAAIVAVCSIIISALKQKGIYIGSHIKRCAAIDDADFNDYKKDILRLNSVQFAVLDEQKGQEMKTAIINAKNQGDSVGGVLETAIIGLPVGLGEPWFDSFEGLLSHILFSVPAVKGVEFGAGFAIADMLGSTANDEFIIDNGVVSTNTNNNGGINGGITNGMPVVFKTAIKPTPTISKEQNTIDFIKNENAVIASKGRHDPCIVQRARVVVDSVAALVVSDLLLGKFGTDWLVK